MSSWATFNNLYAKVSEGVREWSLTMPHLTQFRSFQRRYKHNSLYPQTDAFKDSRSGKEWA